MRVVGKILDVAELQYRPEVKFIICIRGHSMTTWTKRGGRWFKKSLFLSTFRVKNVHVEVGSGQKRAKLCPRNH